MMPAKTGAAPRERRNQCSGGLGTSRSESKKSERLPGEKLRRIRWGREDAQLAPNGLVKRVPFCAGIGKTRLVRRIWDCGFTCRATAAPTGPMQAAMNLRRSQMTIDDSMPKAHPEYRPQIRPQHQSIAGSCPGPIRKGLRREGRLKEIPQERQ